jgi:hypothetical protein
MICPHCFNEECRRSHRRGARDFLLGLTGLRPWRCRECSTRFFAWSVPNSLVQYAHCPRCGNLDVRRISREYVTGPFAWLFGKLGLPAYRCAPCRYKFFTIRRHLRIVPAPQSPAPEAESSSSPPR